MISTSSREKPSWRRSAAIDCAHLFFESLSAFVHTIMNGSSAAIKNSIIFTSSAVCRVANVDERDHAAKFAVLVVIAFDHFAPSGFF